MSEGLSDLTISPLTPLSVPELVRIENESSPAPWSARLFEEEFRCGYSTVLGAHREGRLVGFLVYHEVADEHHILNIAVEKASRRCGIATALLRHLIESPAEAPIDMVTLEVRTSNVAAQALYRQFGFKEVGCRPGYYADNQEDAILMTRRNKPESCD